MATASPLAGAVDHLQGGNRLRPGPHANGRPTVARPPAKGRPAAARASPQGGVARPRPDRRGSRPRVAGCSASPARGDSRPWPRRRGCCRRSPAASPQGAADCGFDARRKAAYGQRTSPARAATCKGDRQQRQRLQGRRPWRSLA
ncbi:hypothetical protein GW17_00061345 [Ensete ventricosum]|nr:hypothetical protein GW17_00061345 [Ensete ventricosum]